jgi:uncharacterized membrane protein
MENLVVTTFQTVQDATEGLNRLKELDQLGDITIYNMALIRKTSESQFGLLHQEGPDSSYLPATGAMAGTLIGALGGPVGMAIGMLTGVVVGVIDEDDRKAFSEDFLNKVNSQVSTGTFAIVLDVEEDNEFMINSYMQPYKGMTVHTAITDQLEDYDEEQWDELDREIDEEEKELRTATDKDKAVIQEKIRKLKDEKDKKIAKFKVRAVTIKGHLAERIKELDQKIKTSKGAAGNRMTKARDKIKEKLSKLDAKIEKASV